MRHAAKSLTLTALILLVSGALGLRLLEIIYRASCNHRVEDRPWELLILTSFFVTLVIMGIIQRTLYKPTTRSGRFFSTIGLLWGLEAAVPACFCVLDIMDYGHLNGPMSIPFIFPGLVYYAIIIAATLLLTSIFYLRFPAIPMTARAHNILRISGFAGLILLIEVFIGFCMGRFTVIDLGGVLAEPGQMVPILRHEQDFNNYHTRLWKKGEHYIAEIPIAFIPARYPILFHETPDWRYGPEQRQSLNATLYTRDKAEPWNYPEERFYAVLTLNQLEILCRRDKIAYPPSLKKIPLIPAEQFDLEDATLVFDSRVDKVLILPELQNKKRMSRLLPLRRLSIHRLPSRRTWYNRCLQPLSWCAEVVYIPLSMIATPIGWLADAIYEGLNN